MLYVQFYLDDYRYVMPSADVVEIVPEVGLTPIPQVPAYIKGIFHYRGTSVPVIDVCRLFLDRFCRKKLSTRIILIKVTTVKGNEKIIGLLVEKSTETIKAEKDSFMDSGVYNSEVPCVGPVLADEYGLITLLIPQDIFEHIDSNVLFPE